METLTATYRALLREAQAESPRLGTAPLRVLIVDRDAEIAFGFRSCAETLGLEPVNLESAEAASQLLAEQSDFVAVVFADPAIDQVVNVLLDSNPHVDQRTILTPRSESVDFTLGVAYRFAGMLITPAEPETILAVMAGTAMTYMLGEPAP